MVALAWTVSGCPSAPPDLAAGDNDDSSSAAESESVGPTTSNTETPEASSGSESSGEAPEGSSGAPAACGDGELTDDEACDDGINDGAYGGCLPDCSGPAGFCGDAVVNGTEVCDDGVNDGSYGGCMVGCRALAARCGDGELDAGEGCDAARANENGSGCNVDCVPSGQSVGLYELGGLSFCMFGFPTRPAFRPTGEALIAVSSYCGGDDVVLIELSPTLDLVRTFDVLIPYKPIRQGVLLGDDWLLSSDGPCNYVISSAGALEEVCEERTVGWGSLAVLDDSTYAAIDMASPLVQFGPGSPALGDAPQWSAAPPTWGGQTYSFVDAVYADNDSVVVVGSAHYNGDPDDDGYIAQFTSAGNLVMERTVYDVGVYAGIHRHPDGGFVVHGSYSNCVVWKLDSDFDVEWEIPLPAISVRLGAAVDSAGDIVVLYADESDHNILRKFDADGQERWATNIDDAYDSLQYRLAIDAADAIWVVGVAWVDGMQEVNVEKFSP